MIAPPELTQNVMLVFDDALEAVWFVQFEGGDWLGGLMRRETGFELRFRWRYYRDEKAFNSSDIKNEYRWLIPRDLEKALTDVAFVVRTIVMAKRGRPYQCIREGRTTEAMARYWFALPFNHVEREENVNGRT